MKCDVEPSAFLWVMGQEGHILRATFVLQPSNTSATLTKDGYLNEKVDCFNERVNQSQNAWISRNMEEGDEDKY